MNKVIKYMACVLHLFFFMSSFSYIYEVRVLKKWNDQRNSYHYFIGLSDFHDKIDPSNQTQLKIINDLFLKIDKNKTRVAIEDLSSVNNDGRASCGRYMVNSRGGVLGGLAQTSRDIGMKVNNVEFRYCRVVALGPVLNNLKSNLNSLPSVADIKMSMLIDEINDEIQQAKTYNDSTVLNAYYVTTINAIQDQFKKLHMSDSYDLSVAQYLEKYSNDANRLEFLKNLLTFDSALLDVKLVHMAADNFKTVDKTITVAGGAHIGRTCDVLIKKDKYKDVSTTKISYAREHDLQKCLGSNIIDGAFCVKPQPIPLHFINGDIFQ